ncbi:protease [Cyanobium sp.]|nr:protease [Cyanobium sp.]
MTPGNQPGPRGDQPAAPRWKQLLALLSLALSLLLWLNGLLDSLSRPSVGNALNRRQLELAVLAEPSLPAPWRPLLAGPQPRQALAEALRGEVNRSAEAGNPAPASLQLLEQGLNQLQSGQANQARGSLEQLLAEAPAGQRQERRLAEALLQPQRPAVQAESQRAALRLVAVTVGPAVVLLLGIALLLRELWQRWRGRSPEAPPLQGPALGGLDVVLLIAGGFVVVGELLTPLLVAPLLNGLLTAQAIASPLREGLSVLGLYLALMAGPLLILVAMLRGLGPAPEGGWLQFRWRPLASALRRALRTLLMVLPLVSLAGWLLEHLWREGSGSNPLLELVLNSHNLPALACFGFTAVVLAPLFEETIFRGVLLPVAARQLGPGWGVLISAAVFAVAHLSLGELLPLLVLGLGLGWLRWSGGRLGSCVLMHALWNGLTFSNLVLLGW